MGVKDLWSILSPICERHPLWELQDKVVAIDMSAWICDSSNIDVNEPNTFLRNLFFRVSYLLLLGAKPIFALEGTAPVLKHNEIERRKAVRLQNKDGQVAKIKSSHRSRLIGLQNQCANLLKYMGVTCYRSSSEAEKLCSNLNKDKLVDGVVSQDSDCFLYGAEVVYRNFTIGARGSGTIDRYSISDIENKLKLGRNHLIALSLFCGCDYNDKGVPGVGKETAMKFITSVDARQILSRLDAWCDDEFDAENYSYTSEKIKKLELNMRQKALQEPNFPFKDIQEEYLNNAEDVSNFKYCWKEPDVKNFVILAQSKLGWSADYALEKIIPILSRWHLTASEHGSMQLDQIVKKRILRGVPSYEIKWANYASTTIEPEHILKLKYGLKIDEYEEIKQQKKKTNKKPRKYKKGEGNDDILQDLTNGILFSGLSLSETKIPEVEMKTCETKSSTSNDLSFNNGTDIENSLTMSDFECTASDLLELSTIVETIVSRR